LTIAVSFFLAHTRDRSQWWALNRGGIMAIVGLSCLMRGIIVSVPRRAQIAVGNWAGGGGEQVDECGSSWGVLLVNM
jgi:hypothetical protein